MLLLGARRTGLTIAEMQEALNVSHRTVYRDLEVLGELGVPLTNEKDGRNTVYQLLEGDRWQLGVPLGLAEIVALHLGVDLLRVQGGAAWSEAAVAALEKLDAAVPGKLLARLEEALGGVSVSTRGRRPYEARQEILATLTRAVQEGRPLDIAYLKPGDGSRPTRRHLHPLAVRLEHGGAYLVALDVELGELRTFLADRVQMATVGEGRFERPPGFAVDDYFAQAFQVHLGGPLVKLRAEFAPRVAHLVTERRWHPSQRARHLEDGGVSLAMQVRDTPELRAWLLGFGGDVVVRAPKALARAMAEEAGRMAAGYAEARGREKRGGQVAARRRSGKGDQDVD